MTIKKTYLPIFLVLGLGVAWSGTAHALGKCTTDTPVSSPESPKFCSIGLSEVYLTQYSVGRVAVQCKRKRINDKIKGKLGKHPSKKKVAKELNHYLMAKPEKRAFPLVIGPEGRFYITDHHHLGTAVWGYKQDYHDYHREHIKVRAFILADYSNKSKEAFWPAMIAANHTWPYDNHGRKITDFLDTATGPFPRHFGDVANDKYRTLSRWTRESCQYIKEGKTQCDAIAEEIGVTPTKADFQEFLWANYMRGKLPWPSGDHDEIDVLKALYNKTPPLSFSPDA
jgi:hypothetical protein